MSKTAFILTAGYHVVDDLFMLTVVAMRESKGDILILHRAYAKQQDPTGQSLVTICIGTQAQTIAKHFNEIGKSAVEIELENTLGEQGKSFPCVVVDSSG